MENKNIVLLFLWITFTAGLLLWFAFGLFACTVKTFTAPGVSLADWVEKTIALVICMAHLI